MSQVFYPINHSQYFLTNIEVNLLSLKRNEMLCYLNE